MPSLVAVEGLQRSEDVHTQNRLDPDGGLCLGDQLEVRYGPHCDAGGGETANRDRCRAGWVGLGMSPCFLGLALEGVEEPLGEAELGRPDPQSDQDGRDREGAGEDGQGEAEGDEEQSCGEDADAVA